MIQTVPDPFGVEHFLKSFRRTGEDTGTLYARAIGAIDATLSDDRIDDGERCRQIRNVISAADMVRAERRQAIVDAAKFALDPLVAEPHCPPECAQNWKAASDPLTHVAHCPNADDLGLTYSRIDDDPQVVRPHSPRVPAHTSALVDGGELIAETPAETATCLHETGGGSALRRRCGVTIWWDGSRSRWAHIGNTWYGHEAVGPVADLVDEPTCPGGC
jgi:hypothetical protein